jgi:flagellar biosynthetic protein FliP
VVSAYVLSELKTAFITTVYVFIPFLVIDLVVSSVLVGMGMMMLPPVVISLPFKLIVFVLMDGWSLLIRDLAAGVIR